MVRAENIEKALIEYSGTLGAIRALMQEANLGGWIGTIGRWLAELNDPNLSDERLCQHIHRSWFATGGMGSLGDIAFPDTKRNQRLQTLVAKLFAQTERLAVGLGCPELSRSKRPPHAV